MEAIRQFQLSSIVDLINFGANLNVSDQVRVTSLCKYKFIVIVMIIM